MTVNLRRITKLILQLSLNGAKSLTVINHCLPEVLQFQILVYHVHVLCACPRVRSPSCGMILRVTLRPASLISLTMSACGMLTMDWLFTASILSPTFSFPQRSAGLPSMMRPILWGTAVGGFKHNTLQVKTRSAAAAAAAADWRITPVCAHTPLTDCLNMSLSLSFCYSPQAYVRHPGFFFFFMCVGDALMLTAVHQEMCVTDVPWEGMYN